jgi:hypothetical protein
MSLPAPGATKKRAGEQSEQRETNASVDELINV